MMQFLTMAGSAIFMIVFFGLCIFVHELGHFLAAKMCGLRIIAFSIGFKKVWAKKINGVEYRIGCIPCGGYVDLPQIDATGDPKDEDGTPLPPAAPWKRMVTAFAGPFFNVIFAFVLGFFIWIFGLPQDTPRVSEIKVRNIDVESPEYRAGLREGDVIFKFNGQTFSRTWSEFVNDVVLNVGDVTLDVKRGNETVKVTYRPEVNRKFHPEEEIPYPFFTPELPVIVYPEKGSPAEMAGIKPGDRIINVNGKEIFGIDELVTSAMYSQGKELDLVCLRDGEETQVKVTPVPVCDESEGRWLLGISFRNDGSDHLTVESVMPSMPCSGLVKKGDQILSANGVKYALVQDFISFVSANKDKAVELEVKRPDGKTETVSVTPVFIVPHAIGVTFASRYYPTPYEQFEKVLVVTWRSLKSVTAGVKRKLGFEAGYTAIEPKHFSGPIGIGKYLYLSVYKGSIMLGLSMVLLLSVNLGIINLLPLPVLDGGHILFALIQMVTRRPIPAKILNPITVAFISLLIAFMLFVTFYDVKKLIPQSVFPGGKTGNTSETGNR